jgi:putative tryptophan/tyrosine transport system substrate-binding protein
MTKAPVAQDPTRRMMLLQCGAFLLAPAAAAGQERGRVYRIGVLTPSSRAQPNYDGLFDELRQLGWLAEGQNLFVDERGFEGGFGQFRALAVGLVRDGIDAILCGGDAAIRAAQQATTAIPIIGVTDDFLAARLVQSLARPGSNTTGISMLAAELDGKRQEILMDLLPRARRMAVVLDSNTTRSGQIAILQKRAHERRVELSIHQVAQPDEVVPAVAAAKTAGADALNMLASPLFNITRHGIIEQAATLHLPTMHHTPEMAVEGGFAGYGPWFSQVGRLQARLLVKVLRGAKPAELPVEQPTRFDLVINLKTAKAMDVDVPATMIALADQVVE